MGIVDSDGHEPVEVFFGIMYDLMKFVHWFLLCKLGCAVQEPGQGKLEEWNK